MRSSTQTSLGGTELEGLVAAGDRASASGACRAGRSSPVGCIVVSLLWATRCVQTPRMEA